jgi:hypothetical protein
MQTYSLFISVQERSHLLPTVNSDFARHLPDTIRKHLPECNKNVNCQGLTPFPLRTEQDRAVDEGWYVRFDLPPAARITLELDVYAEAKAEWEGRQDQQDRGMHLTQPCSISRGWGTRRAVDGLTCESLALTAKLTMESVSQ